MNGPLLLPIGLGFLSLYLLLPRPRVRSAVPGALAGLAAVGALGALLLGPTTGRPLVTAEEFLFYSFAGLAVVFAGLTVVRRNPGHAAIAFAVVVLSTCGLFLLNAAPFLFAATLIIYAGAIIVTFLFVLMLSRQAGYAYTDADDRSREPFLAPVVGMALLGVLLVVVQRAYDSRPLDRLVAQARVAADAVDGEALEAALPAERRKAYFDSLDGEFARLRGYAERTADDATRSKLDAAQGTLDRLRRSVAPGQVPGAWESEVAKPFAELARLGRELSRGVNDPRERNRELFDSKGEELALSPFSEVKAVAGGPRELPAANVPALGRALFMDHLLGIEMAGTLLLVATVGAILIAGDRARAIA